MKLIKKMKDAIVSRASLRSELNRQFFLYKADALTQFAKDSTGSGVSKEKYFEYDVIVSLTTFGKRLNDVYITIESIMQGSCKPNKIILWLQDNLKNTELPIFVKNQQKRGLEVCYCKDLRSYKKLIPTLGKYPDAAIITIDDDVIYREDVVEKLIAAHRIDNRVICANNVHEISLDRNNAVLPYRKWKNDCEELRPSFRFFAVGVGGILYPPHCFNSDVANEKVFSSICPNADDIWFYAMAVTNGFKIMKTQSHPFFFHDYYSNDMFQPDSLSNLNLIRNGGNGNDEQIKKVFAKYDVYKIICRD